jgi:hypothetical protein
MQLIQLLILMFFSFSISAQRILQVEAGNYARQNTPICFPCQGNKAIALVNEETAKTIAVLRNFDDMCCFILDAPLEAQQTRRYKMVNIGKLQTPKTLAVADVLFKTQGTRVLNYNVKTKYPAKGKPDYYKRSGFIHPVFTPSGRILTDPFPVGHEHQHGVFMTWVNTTFQGRKTDFWNQQQQSGTVRATDEKVRQLEYDKMTVLRDELEHVAIDSAKQETVVLKEWQTIQTYPLTTYFLFDISSNQANVSKDTLFINKYLYGGMAFRGNSAWNKADSLNYTSEMEVLTSEGKVKANSNHTKPNWVTAYGMVEGKMVGIAIFDHPSNFRFPQPVRVHPEMPYFCFSPMVEEGFHILPKQYYFSQYRFMAFDGAPDLALIEQVWQDYAFPPTVRVVSR